MRKLSRQARVCIGVLPLLFLLCLSRDALSAESGASHYMQGAYGDFLMADVPGPGFSVRNDTVYMAAHMDGALKGGRVYAGIDQTMEMNITTLTAMFEAPAIGGYLGLGAGLPFIVNEHVTGDVAVDYNSRSRRTGHASERHLDFNGGGDRGGLSDIFLMPVIANWKFGECHLTVMPMVFLPTGYYDKNALTDLGMNYFSFDGNVAFTWLHNKQYELSFNTGYMINTENMATHYLSGNQIHMDWTLAYHVNDALAFGAVGYLFAQTTPDSGSGATMGGFFSSGTGIGPAISCTVPLGSMVFTFEAKWLHGLAATKSFLGETAYGSLIVAF
ncbi:SphA family protein [Solidesulfovibrio sp. C21]|uniref:SphA family protein n=1 Tax=Solidesulfovibrio sp. C21 TaxID=3398613 RepID=UPI0039FD2FFF